MRSRFTAALTAAAAAVVATVALGTGAASATPALPAPGISDGHLIFTENGLPTCVGFGSGGSNPGQPVIERAPSNGGTCQPVYPIPFGVDFEGKPEYLYSFQGSSGGEYMAATNDCQHVTIKASQSDNGTVWTLATISGHIYLYPRYCSPDNGLYTPVMGSDNTPGHQWQIGGRTGSGLYTKVVLQTAG